MAVNSTSSTAMAPRTSLARRESVGTGTGGRMATSGLLQLQSSVAADGAADAGRSTRTTHRTAPGSPAVGSPTASPTSGGAPLRRPRAGPGSAAGRRVPGLEVRQRLQGVVETGDAGQREARRLH